MNYLLLTTLHLTVLLVAPIFLLGLINRTKAICAGRKGPKLYQTALDLVRLLRKKPVYSTTTSWIFQLAPSAVLTSTLLAALLVPIFPGFSPFAFPGDFVAFTYVLGLGRLFLVLAALDTGSSFEGMGSSREVTFAALVEPAFFLVIGTFVAVAGDVSFSSLFPAGKGAWPGLCALAAVALFIILQTEAARVPVDDPGTHLELTMIHEVMILDQSGPDLAIMTYAAALKLTIWLGLLAAVVNPVAATDRAALSALVTLLLMALFAVAIGVVESTLARLRIAAVPYYVLVALGVSLMMFGVTLLRSLLGVS